MRYLFCLVPFLLLLQVDHTAIEENAIEKVIGNANTQADPNNLIACLSCKSGVVSSLQEDLVASWSMNGTVGATKLANAGGSCGPSCTLSVGGGTPTATDAKTESTGGTNGAYALDGSSWLTATGSGTKITWGSELTVCASLERTNLAANDDIVGQWVNGNYATSSWYLRVSSAGNIPFTISTGTGQDVATTSWGVLDQTGKSYRVCVVFNSGSVATYVDAIALTVNGLPLVVTTIPTVATDIRIGEATSSGSRTDGTVDSVTLWSRALTADEIRADFEGLGGGDGVEYPFEGIQ